MRNSFLAVTLLSCWATVAHADPRDQRQRCNNELYGRRETDWVGITKELAYERHLWAKRCVPGFDDDVVRAAEKTGSVCTFTNHREPGLIAPWNRDAPCDNYTYFGMCPLGCFAADQRVLFDGAWMTLQEAQDANVSTFSSISAKSSPFAIEVSAKKEIDYIASGPERLPLIEVFLASGKRVRVTVDHPMITQSGDVIPAHAVALGAMLLTVDGPDEVIKLQRKTDARDVWHLFPKSTAPEDNVVFAEGVATGSLRFQSVWSDKASRGILRGKLADFDVELLAE